MRLSSLCLNCFPLTWQRLVNVIDTLLDVMYAFINCNIISNSEIQEYRKKKGFFLHEGSQSDPVPQITEIKKEMRGRESVT